MEPKPRPLWSFHITATNTRFVVKGKIHSTIFLVSRQVELRDDTRNDSVIQGICVFMWEVFQAVSKVDAPLAHYIVRGDLLGFKVVRCTLDNHVVGIGIPSDGNQSYKQHKTRH